MIHHELLFLVKSSITYARGVEGQIDKGESDETE